MCDILNWFSACFACVCKLVRNNVEQHITLLIKRDYRLQYSQKSLLSDYISGSIIASLGIDFLEISEYEM